MANVLLNDPLETGPITSATGITLNVIELHKVGNIVTYNPNYVILTNALSAKSSTTISTIPAGFRPITSVCIPAMYSDGANNSPEGYGIITVDTFGVVLLFTGELAAPANSRLFFNLAYSVA
jgi:hypothetical protein